jgi:hypothetical protein
MHLGYSPATDQGNPEFFTLEMFGARNRQRLSGKTFVGHRSSHPPSNFSHFREKPAPEPIDSS